MKIEVSNFKYKGRDVSYISHDVRKQFEKLLANKNILSKVGASTGLIVFSPVKDNKLFVSSIKNKIMLKPNDSRIEKKGRNFLDSERLTEQQYDDMLDILNRMFDKTGIECDIKFFEFKDDSRSFTFWRQGSTKGQAFRPQTFPVKV